MRRPLRHHHWVWSHSVWEFKVGSHRNQDVEEFPTAAVGAHEMNRRQNVPVETLKRQ